MQLNKIALANYFCWRLSEYTQLLYKLFLIGPSLRVQSMYTSELEGQSKLFHMHKQKSTPQSTSKNYFIDNFFTFTTKQSTPVIAQENYFHQPTILLTRPMQPGKCMSRKIFQCGLFSVALSLWLLWVENHETCLGVSYF